MNVVDLKNKVIDGYSINKEEAMKLYSCDYEQLRKSANEIRKFFMGNSFDICTIINAKSGRCSEDCKFCSQSVYSDCNIKGYPLLNADEIVADAKRQRDNGILKYSLVTSGKRLSGSEVAEVANVVRRIKEEVNIEVCISGGLLSFENFKVLKEAGVTRVHNNLETSESYFKNVCTTHKFSEKLKAIEDAKKSGMEICSGGIIGLGESVKDRIEMAIELRNLNIKSVPINVLNPIKGTSLGGNNPLSMEEINRTISVFRFILKDSFIRLAGGRTLMKDRGESAFLSGANATISGDLLTTSGIDTKTDIKLIKDLGFSLD